MRWRGVFFERLVDPVHLERAARLTTRGKRRRADVAWFLFRQIEALDHLHRALLAGTWQPGGFELLYLRDPKPRVIARSSVEDRVVHTALVSLLEPVFMPSAMPEDYACRPGFGTERAVLRVRELMRRHRFAVHLDVRAFFPSIEVDLLVGLVRRRVRDARFLAVLKAVLDAGRGLYDTPRARAWARLPPAWPPPGRGLPMGALTSQFLATHVYLGGLDHFVKRDLKVPGMVRYVDDVLLFGDARADMRCWRREVGRWLREERDLRLKHPDARILSCAGHIDALGRRITRSEHRPLPRTWRRLRARGFDALHRRPGRAIRDSLAAGAGLMMAGTAAD
jgi:RNA-directed DNA polymerase